ncbi:peptidase S8 [Brevibacillus fluminis]|uniref:Peptidase S8 n=1 Tax=Brevibacillus fluminis TaxID=511487 RepID=A0A3M8DQW3_9BACL|nr:S8 family peptidase [Brevibacillus fluminis]RNB89841.1 peptidase S8 [Brevibacillus fluminis]
MMKRGHSFFLGSLITALLVTGISPVPTAQAAPRKAASPKVADGELIVRYKQQKKQQIHALHASSRATSIDGKTVLLKTDADTMEETAATLAKEPDVAFVEPNYIYHASESSSSRVGSSAVDDPHYDDLWGLRAIDAPQAWDTLASWKGRQTEQVTVAVVDTGVDASHPDLAGRVLATGYNTVAGNTNTFDDDGHGTHVSGTIAAVANNGIGVTGVAGSANVRILPIKVLDDNGEGTALQIAQGVDKAVELGADIINMSLGGLGRSRLLEESIHNATQKGVLVVVAAGNETDDAEGYAPASFADVVTVASVDKENMPSYFSNYGSPIDMAAPGENILSTVPGGEYDSYNGTSMATPHVTAAAALVKMTHPSWGPEEIRAALEQTAVDLGKPGIDSATGHGLLQVDKALTYDATPVMRVVSPSRSSDLWGTFAIEAAVINQEAVSVRIADNAGNELVTLPVEGGKISGRIDSGTLGTGKQSLRLQAYDAHGRTVGEEISWPITIHQGADGGLRVTVTDAEGRPADGAQVVLYSTDGPGKGYEEVARYFANEQGYCYLPKSVRNPDEQYVVVANYFDWDTGNPFTFYQRLSDVGSQNDVTLAFGETHPLSVNVLSNGKAQPLADTSLVLVPHAVGMEAEPIELLFDPNQKGQFDINLPDGTYTAYALRHAASGQNYFVEQDVTVADEAQKLTFDLDKAVPVRFTLPKGVSGGIWTPESKLTLDQYGVYFKAKQPILVTPAEELANYSVSFGQTVGKKRYVYELKADKPLDWTETKSISLLARAKAQTDDQDADIETVKPGDWLDLNYTLRYNDEHMLSVLGLAEQNAANAPVKPNGVSGQLLLPRAAATGEQPAAQAVTPQVKITDQEGKEVWTGAQSRPFIVPDDPALTSGRYKLSLDFAGFPFAVRPQTLDVRDILLKRVSSMVDVSYTDPEGVGFSQALLRVYDDKTGNLVAEEPYYGDLFGGNGTKEGEPLHFKLDDVATGKTYRFQLAALTKEHIPLYSEQTIRVTDSAVSIDLSSKEAAMTKVSLGSDSDFILGIKQGEEALPFMEEAGANGYFWLQPGTYQVSLGNLDVDKPYFFEDTIEVDGDEYQIDAEPDYSQLKKIKIDMPSQKEEYTLGLIYNIKETFGVGTGSILVLMKGDAEMYMSDELRKALSMDIVRSEQIDGHRLSIQWSPALAPTDDGYVIKFDKTTDPTLSLAADKETYHNGDTLDVSIDVTDNHGNKITYMFNSPEASQSKKSEKTSRGQIVRQRMVKDENGKTVILRYDRQAGAYQTIEFNDIYPRIQLQKDGEKIDSVKQADNWTEYQYDLPDVTEPTEYTLLWSLSFPYERKAELVIKQEE